MQRLQSRAQFQAVLAGRIVSKTAHFSLHQLVVDPSTLRTEFNDVSDIWLGAMAPKRWAKRAVTRNMVKRQVYTVVSQLELPVAAYLIRLRAEFSKKKFLSATSPVLKRAVRDELHLLLSTTLAWIQPTAIAHPHPTPMPGPSKQGLA